MARIDVKDLTALLRAIEVYAERITRLAMELLALTFVRTSELIEARRDESLNMQLKHPLISDGDHCTRRNQHRPVRIFIRQNAMMAAAIGTIFGMFMQDRNLVLQVMGKLQL